MATGKAVWTIGVVYQAAVVIAAAGSQDNDINLNTAGYDIISVQPKVIFGATPTGNFVINFYGSSDGGVTIDTEPFLSIPITEATSATKIITVPVKDRSYVRITATNNDPSDNVTYSGKYEGRLYDIS